MKKIISILIAAFICGSLISCGQNGTAESKPLISAIGDSSALTVSELAPEIDLGYKWEQRSGAPKTLTVDFEGMTLIGEYTETGYLPYYESSYDEYKGTCEEGIFYFGINIKTGKVVRYDRYLNESSARNPEEKNTREERLQIAENYLAKYTDGEYILYNEQENEHSKEDMVHRFYFQKIINGHQTADIVEIGINTSGELTDILFDIAPSMENVEIPNFDIDEKQKLVEERLDEVVTDGTSYEIISCRVARLTDGKYGIEYNVHLTQGSEPDLVSTSLIQMFVYV